MLRDPRNPDPDFLISAGSTHSAHSNLRKTLSLLKIEGKSGDIFFVVEGLSMWPTSLEELQEHERYFYEEHTCPTNLIRVPLIMFGGDNDPHGIFHHVESVWMTDEYETVNAEGGADEYLEMCFPQLRK